jgi:hypothetical protein
MLEFIEIKMIKNEVTVEEVKNAENRLKRRSIVGGVVLVAGAFAQFPSMLGILSSVPDEMKTPALIASGAIYYLANEASHALGRRVFKQYESLKESFNRKNPETPYKMEDEFVYRSEYKHKTFTTSLLDNIMHPGAF